jgi:hypothetical protein
MMTSPSAAVTVRSGRRVAPLRDHDITCSHGDAATALQSHAVTPSYGDAVTVSQDHAVISQRAGEPSSADRSSRAAVTNRPAAASTSEQTEGDERGGQGPRPASSRAPVRPTNVGLVRMPPGAGDRRSRSPSRYTVAGASTVQCAFAPLFVNLRQDAWHSRQWHRGAGGAFTKR